MKHDVALTETARIAVSVNSKHREVQRLGRTAKDIATEIGEELIKVKQNKAVVPHGHFKQWVSDNCAFSYPHAARYMQLAKVKSITRDIFDRATSIREALEIKDTKPAEDPQQKRSATLDDLRKVERLRALRDVSCLLRPHLHYFAVLGDVQYVSPLEHLRSFASLRIRLQKPPGQNPHRLCPFQSVGKNQHHRLSR